MDQGETTAASGEDQGAAVDRPDERAEVRRKQSRGERRAQLIEATIATIATRGYARTTMGDVARSAGLSHGLVNFHFETKEKLFSATLDYLAEEYRQNWQDALEQAQPEAPAKIAAMLMADFNPAICTPNRLYAWCAFWGEAQSRPLYQEHCGSNDSFYNATLESFCRQMNSDHGYATDPVRTARILRVTVEGLWLDQMTMHAPYDLTEAVATVWTCAAQFYPGHFGPKGLLRPE
jgi:TetR/AcrR family transcriptional repressor of bet genes